MRKLIYLLVLPLMFSCKAKTSEVANEDKNGDAAVEMLDFRAELNGVMEQTIDKYVSLAEAMPENLMDWRPAEGVRSVKEAVMHAAGANYNLGKKLGGELPEGINPRALEANSKQEMIGHYKNATSFFVNALNNTEEAALADKVEFFDGNMYSKEMISMINLAHTSEHLGQLIAYARSNGITPPWSETE